VAATHKTARHATVVPGYSGGPAADLHGIPLTESEAIIVLPMIHLVIGGARSGKSTYAERQARESGLAVTYIATCEARDQEMNERIAHHRDRRPAEWRTVEEPLRLADALLREAGVDTCLMVDCLTLWLTNALLGDREEEIERLLTVLPTLPGRILLVSNEVGWGIVPENALARRFRDEQGRLNQRIAAIADDVTLVAAGLPLRLKYTPPPPTP
jgi:adenosylcobinamide kinase/adenosylcobinamide-phosphate guanylyltransferase